MRFSVIMILVITALGYTPGSFAQSTCNLSLAATPVGASCSNACDGSVILTPSGGTAPYSFNGFDHSFPGSSVDLSLFDVRNGNFSVSGNQLIATANPLLANDYDNSISTKQAFNDNGKIVVEGSFYIDYNTYGNFGLAQNAIITTQPQLPYSFFFNYGTLYIMNEGSQTFIMNYSSSTWYDLKIEKIGTTVNYYLRSTGLAAYSLVATKTASLSNTSYKLAAIYNNLFDFYGGFKTTNWRVGGNPPTTGLCPGTYQYTVFDAAGCFTTATVTLGINTGPGSLSLNGSATAASCATASDGSTSLLVTGGVAPYSYGFAHAFQGSTINQNIFELRNGNFSQGSDLRQGTNYNNNNSWDNSISTRRTFSDGGYLIFQGSFKFDANADVILGLTDTGIINDYTDMRMGFRVSNGTQLFAYTDKAGLVSLPAIMANTWYDFKIEKTGNTLKFYSRLMNTGSFILRHSRTYSSSRVEYKAAALNFANFFSSSGGYNTKAWNVESVPKTTNLLPGTYTYTITDAAGCTATKVLNVIADIDNVVTLNASLVNGACGNAANGVISLTPSSGRPPYSYAFTQSFSGNMIQSGLFEIRNGSFVQDGTLRGEMVPISTLWDNSIATYYTFTDAAKLSFEGSFKFDPTANVYFGFVSNVTTINDPSLVQIGYFVSGTQLYVRAGGSNIAVGSLSSDTWYDFKIEKQENVVWFYSRINGSGQYNLLTAIPYSGTQTIFRFGALMYASAGNFGGFNSKNWMINDNPPTTGLAAGNYTYKVYDAAGCYAGTTINVPSNNNFTVNAQTTNATTWNSCDGTVSLTSSGTGALSYLSRLYRNTFTGTTLNTSNLIIRNGAFAQNNELIQNNQLTTTGWDNSIATSQVFTDNGKLIVDMDMQFQSGTEVYFGFADPNQPVSSSNAMLYAFKYAGGNLYAHIAGSGPGNTQIANVGTNQWNNFRIEKHGNTVKFYIRPVQDNQYQLLYTATVSTSTNTYRIGILNYFTNTSGNRSYRSRNWNVYAAAFTTGLCKGTYTYAVTEASGCMADVTFSIAATLSLVQTMTPPANVTVNTNPGASFASNVNLGTPGFAAPPAGITITNNAPAQFPLGTTIVTWTAVDAEGLTVTGTQTVTVQDNEPPVISAPADITAQLFIGQTTLTLNIGTATASDNVPGVVVTNNAPAQFSEGTTIITWTATDAAGNTTTATQTVTVTAISLPPVTAPADVTVNTDAGQAYATNVALGNPVIGGSLTGLVISNDAPAQFPVGTTTVTWTISLLTISASVTQTVTVTDNENPVISAPANISVSTNTGQSFATILSLGTAIAADNVGISSITNNAPAQFPVGNTIVTWTASDAAGNIATATQVVTVSDNEIPTITAPPGVTVNTDLNSAYATNVALGNATSNDNVPGVIVSNNAPAQYPVGTTIVTWTATDAAGNTATATQAVTVTDNQPPVITAPADVSVVVGLNQAYATNVVLGNATATDNVPGVSVSNNGLTQYPVGATTVVWTATDAAGNTATASQVVTVTVMAQPPVAGCRPVTVTLVNGTAMVTAAQVNNGSTAAAGIASMSLSKTSFDCSNIGDNTVVLTVTDNNGLTSSCTTTVTVVGQVTPVSITSVPTSAVNTGGIATNLYIGYGAQSTKLQVNAPASGAPYTYSWSGTGLSSTSSAAPVFTPTAAGNYTFTVTATNTYGCASASSITICVKDIRVVKANGTKDDKKVYVCHIPPGNPANAHTIEVSINAVAAHLAHGDKLGSCNQACGSTSRPIMPVVMLEESFEVKVSPNPTSNYFILQVSSADKANKITVRITDAFGRTIQQATVNAGSNFRFGDRYTNGTYFAEVTQGEERKLVRLLKL